MRRSLLLRSTTLLLVALALSIGALAALPRVPSAVVTAQGRTRALSDVGIEQQLPCEPFIDLQFWPGVVRASEPVTVELAQRFRCAGLASADVVLLVEGSQYVSGEPLDEIKADAQVLANLILDHRIRSRRVAVVEYDTSAKTQAALTFSEDEIARGLDRVTAAGGARIDVGIAEALRVLQRAPAVPNKPTPETQVIVLYGTGQNANADAEAIAAAERARADGVLVFSVCTTTGCDARLMRDLVDQEGRFSAVGDPRSLYRAIEQASSTTPRPARVMISAEWSPAASYFDGSAVPEPVTVSHATATLHWDISRIPESGLTQTYRVAHPDTGMFEPRGRFSGQMIDSTGQSVGFAMEARFAAGYDALFVAPPRGDVDGSPCDTVVSRSVTPDTVHKGETAFVSTTVTATCHAGPRLLRLHLTDRLADHFEFVPAPTWQAPTVREGGRILDFEHEFWQEPADLTWRATFAYRVRARESGDRLPVSSDAIVAMLDTNEQIDGVEVPRVEISVVGGVATPQPTGDPTALGTRIHLPAVMRNHCTSTPCISRADFVMVADLSPSMRELSEPDSLTKLGLARLAMAGIVAEGAWAGDRAGLIACNGRSRLLQPLTLDREAVATSALGLTAESEDSRLDLCLDHARDVLPVAPHRGGSVSSVLLLTDGRTHVSQRHLIERSAARARASGIGVHVLAIGSEVDRRFLERLAGSDTWVTSIPYERDIAAAITSAAYLLHCPLDACPAER